jgi:hypothetical protein
VSDAETGDGGPQPTETTSPVCPRCSTPVEPAQEYCLECGLRLPHEEPGVLERASAGLAERQPWSSGWLVPSLLGLVIAVLGTGAAIAISDRDTEPAAVPTATGGSRTVAEPQPTLTAPEPTTPATTTAAPPPTTTAAPPTTTAPPVTTAWPADRRGWTIVLVSVPQSAGRPLASQRAADARRNGLPDAGVLNSSRFASLHPGYFVVFTGVYESQAEATSSLPRARSVFPLAYAREIVP